MFHPADVQQEAAEPGEVAGALLKVMARLGTFRPLNKNMQPPKFDIATEFGGCVMFGTSQRHGHEPMHDLSLYIFRIRGQKRLTAI
ncbi:hypothetical protein E2R55_10310 [Vibrio vulnificus]|nr:hypothetical protein E2R55_10310 [Vibrio vulnificus]